MIQEIITHIVVFIIGGIAGVFSICLLKGANNER